MTQYEESDIGSSASKAESRRRSWLWACCLLAAMGTGSWLWWLAPEPSRIAPAVVQEEPVMFSAPGSR